MNEDLDEARKRVAASGAPALSELIERLGNWPVPEVSGMVCARDRMRSTETEGLGPEGERPGPARDAPNTEEIRAAIDSARQAGDPQ